MGAHCWATGLPFKGALYCLGPGRGGGTPLFGLYGDVPLDRVWFFGLAVLNRVLNLTCLCSKTLITQNAGIA